MNKVANSEILPDDLNALFEGLESKASTTVIDQNSTQNVAGTVEKIPPPYVTIGGIGYTREEIRGKYQAVFGEILPPTFDAFAPNWKMQRDECEMLAVVYSDVCAKHFPQLAEYFGCELMAILLTIRIFMKRRGVPLREPEKKPEVKNPEPGEKQSKENTGQASQSEQGTIPPGGKRPPL